VASLVLGGYDLARINGTSAQFMFQGGGSTPSELLVSVSSISIQYHNGSGPASSMGTPFEAIIDSTLPYLFLPRDTCDWLAEKLNLTYHQPTDLYLIDQASIVANKDSVGTFTMTLGSVGQASKDSSIIDIVFPYDAFNANATWTWGFANVGDPPQPIFPIRRAPTSTAVLGRPFFQEAYVSADYVNQTFNVSQTALRASFSGNTQIFNAYNTSVWGQLNSQTSHKLGAGAIAGIAIGGLIALAIAVALLWFFCIRKKPEPPPEKVELTDVKVNIESPRPETLDRRDTFESMSSSLTEMDGVGVPRRPSYRHSRGVSELSSGSDETYADGTGRTRTGPLGAIAEMGLEDKSDAAKYERFEAERRARDAAEPAELEGEGHLMQTLPAR